MPKSERKVSLFRNGANQALRIPKDLEFEADEATIRREGDRLIVEPIRRGRLLALLASMDPICDEFPDVDADLPDVSDVSL